MRLPLKKEGELPEGATLRVTLAFGGKARSAPRRQTEIELPASDSALREALSRGPAPFIVRVRGANLGPNMTLAATRAGDVWRLNTLAKQLSLAAPSAPFVAEQVVSLIRRPPTIEDAMSAIERVDDAFIDMSSSGGCQLCGRKVLPPIPYEELERRIGRRYDEARLGREPQGEEYSALASRYEAMARDDQARERADQPYVIERA